MKVMKSILLVVAFLAVFGLGYFSHAYTFAPADCVEPALPAHAAP